MRLPAGLLVVLVASAGCLTVLDGPPDDETEVARGTEPWSPHRCDPSGATDVNQDAPRIAPWRQDRDALASRFADAIGDPLTPDGPEDETADWARWATESGGTVHYNGRSQTSDLSLSYHTQRMWPGADEASARADLERFLDEFGTPDHVDLEWSFSEKSSRAGVFGTFAQPVDDTTILTGRSTFDSHENPASATGWFASFQFHPLFDLRSAHQKLTPAEAGEIAQAYDRCVMDQEGKTAAAGWTHHQTHTDLGWLVVRNTSLARPVLVSYDEPGEPSHCGFSHEVHVDVVTGAVLGHAFPPCD